MVGGRRKMLAARDDLADKVGKIAAARGFTVFSMVNDLLDLAIQVDEMGISLKEAVEAYELAKEVKDASFVLVSENLLYDTAQLAFERSKEKTLKVWFDAGVLLAKKYVARGDEDSFAVFEKELRVFSWNVPEIAVERSGPGVAVRVLSPRFSESYTALFNNYLVGVLTGFGYEVTFNEVGRGNIRLEAMKKGR